MENEQRFLEAMRKGDLKPVDEMLKYKIIDANHIIDGRRILNHAIESEQPDIVSCVIDHGADVSADDFDALVFAVTSSCDRDEYNQRRKKPTSVRIVEIILDAIKRMGNADDAVIAAVFVPKYVDEHYDEIMSIFMKAVVRGLDQVACFFLDMIDERHHPLFKLEWFSDRWTFANNPFHRAYNLKLETVIAIFEKLPFARQLVNSKDLWARTPLHRIIETGYSSKDYIKLLISKGADLDLVNCFGETPLHGPLFQCLTSESEALLRAGCRTDICDKDGSSALNNALRAKCKKGLELLLAFGVDLRKEPYLYDEEELPDEFKLPQ